MKQRQHFFSKIPISRITKIYVVLLCITMAKTFANEISLNELSLKIENVEVLNNQLQTVITGAVVDESGSPLPGVTILVKGTTKGTSTDFDGNYSVEVADSNATLIFSYVGFLTQEIQINNQSTIDVTLIESASELDEVVVVGYGSQKKVNLTGSIATIKSDDIVQNNTQSVSSALAGRLAGVVTIQSSGEPGSSSSSVNIRGLSTLGSNAPLILVDGIPRSLNNVNANDIENISVLKDAAASIYGSRGANGVVQISLKK